jgi:hypothetical protein
MASITQTLMQSLFNSPTGLGASVDPTEKGTVSQDDEDKQLADAQANPFDFSKYSAPSMIPPEPPAQVPAGPSTAYANLPTPAQAPKAALGGGTSYTPKSPSDLYGADLNDAALKAAQADRDNQLFMANLSRGANTVGAALGRGKVEANNTVNDQITKSAGNKAADILARRSAKDEEVSRELNLSKLASERDLADPNSAVSRAMRDQASKYGLNLGNNVAAREAEKLIQNAAHWSEVQLRAQALKDAAAERNQDKKDKAQKLNDHQVGAINDFDTTIANAKNAMDMLGNHSEWTGSLDGRVPDAMVGDDQVAFRSAVGRMSDAYRKLITGAGAGNAELARLESRMPMPTDTFSNFKSKALELMKESEAAKERYLNNAQRMGKNVSDYRASPMSPNQTSLDQEKDALSAGYDADVLQYAKDHGITPAQAQRVKDARTKGQ